MKRKASFILITTLIFSFRIAFSQSPVKQWDARFGGSNGDALLSQQQTSDSGFILGGYSASGISGDKTQASRGGQDYWIVKTDANGTKQWDARFGGDGDDNLFSVQQTADGGYILGGQSSSGISGDKTQTAQGGFDYWIVKTDANGIKQWDARFGGNQYEELSCIRQTTDGGYILGGFSESGISGDKTQPGWGLSDYWIVKTDANGVKQWDARFGGDQVEELHSLQQTTDGGYILGGKSESGISGDKTQVSRGDADYWIVKTDANGSKQWDARFGGSSGDALKSILQTTDGGYLLSGHSFSGAGGDKTQASQGSADYWVVKTDANGIKQWDMRFGGNSTDYLLAADETNDGYIFGGDSNSGISGDKTQPNWGPANTTDYWIVKTDAAGIKQWDARFGGSSSDLLLSLQQTLGAGFILGGYSRSGMDGDKTQDSRGNFDYWIVKLAGSDPLFLFFADADGDGYGSSSSFIYANTQPNGYVSDSMDCDDGNAFIHPFTADVCNSVDDNCDGLTDEHAITATVNPAGVVTACSGSTIQLTANNEAGIIYQWLKNNVPVPGATNGIYTTSKGGNYQVSESNSFSCNSISPITSISIKSKPMATITPLGNLDLCATGSVMLQANSGTGYTYQWQKGNNLLAGATDQVYTATQKATYKVNVTNSSGCSKTSAGAKVTKSCREGEEDHALPGLLIYPNPATTSFMVSLSSETDPLLLSAEVEITVEILNLSGQVIYREKTASTNFESGLLIFNNCITRADSWPDGMYFVKVSLSACDGLPEQAPWVQPIIFQK